MYNAKCRGFLSPKTYRTKCAKCGCEYELKLANIIVTRGLTQKVSYNLSIHKLEDSELVAIGLISKNKKEE